MYEPVSHSLLNQILNELSPKTKGQDLYYFYTRMGANFYSIHKNFSHLYGGRSDLDKQLYCLVKAIARQYLLRPKALRKLDLKREENYTWYLDQRWVGMTLYVDGFARNLKGLKARIPYFKELGINLVHVMPLLQCPDAASDGGYAVSDFRKINQRFGSMDDIVDLADSLRQHNILLVFDVVVNHTSNEHEWAIKAKQGDPIYQDYYYTFPDRVIPDMFEETLPEVFPEHAPGNFTWDEKMQRWVMTVFHDYQWDLNYNNPSVFIEMLDILFFWANQGADILRLDAVAFLWKRIGGLSQNEKEAHLILQLLKDCCQVAAPGVLFIAEAIVAPVEVVKYFGEDAVEKKECEIAYNATLMALLWDAVATKNAKLLTQGVKSLPAKLKEATWLNYIRCHDDIGLGFDDSDIAACSYNPSSHRQFLIDYFTGKFSKSDARGRSFGQNKHNSSDARISGTLTSLIGLEYALETDDQHKIDTAIKHIILLYGIIFSIGGIPLIYYGDEIGTVNDYDYISVLSKANDSRWLHRPKINWQIAELRHQPHTHQHQIFSALQRMIIARAKTPEFFDLNNRKLIDLADPHLFAYARIHPARNSQVIVIANFNADSRYINLSDIHEFGDSGYEDIIDIFSGNPPKLYQNQLVLSSYQFYWLKREY